MQRSFEFFGFQCQLQHCSDTNGIRSLFGSGSTYSAILWTRRERRGMARRSSMTSLPLAWVTPIRHDSACMTRTDAWRHFKLCRPRPPGMHDDSNFTVLRTLSYTRGLASIPHGPETWPRTYLLSISGSKLIMTYECLLSKSVMIGL